MKYVGIHGKPKVGYIDEVTSPTNTRSELAIDCRPKGYDTFREFVRDLNMYISCLKNKEMMNK